MADQDGMTVSFAAARWDMIMPRRVPMMVPVPATSREHWFGILDGIGAEAFLEFVAEGNLPVELARANKIPALYLREWIESRVDKKRLATAFASFAEFAALRSAVCLEAQPENPHEASVQKAMSETWRWMAERTDPARWTPPKGNKDPLPAVNISLHMAAGQRPQATLQARATPIEAEDVKVEARPAMPMLSMRMARAPSPPAEDDDE